MKEKTFCVYCHTNKINGKRYIGITSQKPEYRWRNGLGYREGAFHRAIEKYGWDGFTHEVVYYGLKEEEAKKKEIDLIEKYKTKNKKYGYNMTRGGDGTLGFKKSDAERLEMSITRKGRHAGEKNPMYGKSGPLSPHYGIPMSDYAKKIVGEGVKKAWADGKHNTIKKPVIGINGKGESFWFGSVADAARATGIVETHIARVCRGKRKHAGGYAWSYIAEQKDTAQQ